jgi:hypothetical protein
MKHEKQNLIHDLLDEGSSRDAILLAGSQVLRRRRHWRTARQSAVVLALVAAVAVLVLRKETPQRSSSKAASAKPKLSPVSQVHALTDDELLGLFPNTPVGLASMPDGKKRLIFPRPGDEEKFITRL